jgi:hypothetical protein
MRKRQEKKYTKQFSPAANASSCWRVLYERTAFPFISSIRGQLQVDKFVDFNVDANTQHCTAVVSSADGFSVDIVVDNHDLKGAWRTILACGKSIERQLSGELGRDKRPLLSTLVTFVGNAYRLPLPETCFGAHHVVVEEVANMMVFILEQIQEAQQVQALIRDYIYKEAEEGIDSDSLKRILYDHCGMLPITLTEAKQLYECRAMIIEWECKLSSLFDTEDEDSEVSAARVLLEDAESYRAEARKHGYLSRTFVQLVSRIHRARDLRRRILHWKDHGGRGSLKTLSALVKEIHRINLSFAESEELLEINRVTESWIDRANVVTRSKSSLCVIHSLILAAKAIPLDLTENLEKLKTRMRTAERWLKSLNEVISVKQFKNKLEWMSNLNFDLHNFDHARLYELSLEGSRMPVVVDEATILQVAFDANKWTSKAKKWMPGLADSKEGKLSDLREHLTKLAILRDRLPFSDSDKAAWSPEGETQLSAIVDDAHTWLEKVCKPFSWWCSVRSQ